jgi:hypothetical protein
MCSRRSLLAFVTLAAVTAALVAPSSAIDLAELGSPQGAPILTVSGAISATNVGDTAQFDQAMLEKIGMVAFKTTTPWFTGEVEFEGVPMDALMQTVGATGVEVEAIALNDYKATVPVEDFAKYGVVLALKRDGEYMPVRDKGPLFIVYPYDEYDELQAQKFYSRSVWQLKELVVR